MPKPTKPFTRFELDAPTTAREVLQRIVDRDLTNNQYSRNQIQNLLREVPAMKDAIDPTIELRWFEDPVVRSSGHIITLPGFYGRRTDVLNPTWTHEPAAQFAPQDAARYFSEMAYTL